MFNPLEIGEMIESEDFDWEPPAAAQPPLRAAAIIAIAVTGQRARRCRRAWTTPAA